MNLEIIYIVGAWLLASEIIFISWMYFREDKGLGLLPWYMVKVGSFLSGSAFIMLQLNILNPSTAQSFLPITYHWINLFYESIVIGGIASLIFINKKIAGWIENK